MRYSHLQQITTYLQKFKKISAIYRVSDTVMKIAFDKNDEIYFNMNRSNSTIYKAPNFTRAKIYNAPFDVVLSKRFNRANIDSIKLINNDKILQIQTSLASAYKEEISYLQIEFTGKYTNIIILDQEKIVLEALRHIDLFSSFREVKVGQSLLDIPPTPFTPKEYPLDDVEKFLYDVYRNEQEQRLSSLKKQKINLLNKKLQKLQKLYNSLEDEQTLTKNATTFEHYGNLILSNIYLIKPYTKVINILDYDGKEVEIKLDKLFGSVSKMANYMFAQSKKNKQKAKNLHIEKSSLDSKIKHLKLFINTVKDALNVEKINLLFPKKVQGKKIRRDDSIEVFWIEGYKVQLGKNEKGNIALLKNARAKDIWIHMKDRPSAHVIITTDKQNLPLHIIEEASRLCIDFTMIEKDRYLVDYTPRREVTIQNRANVLYNKYKTIEIDTRG